MSNVFYISIGVIYTVLYIPDSISTKKCV